MNHTTYTSEEIAAHRAEWLRALRSGEWKQGKQRLRSGDEYCCLGVACTLAGIEGVLIEDEGGWPHGPTYLFDDDHLTLPARAQNWLGVEEGNPTLGIPRQVAMDTLSDDTTWARDVASLNDEGFTFNQLADLIEYFGFVEPGSEDY